MTTPGPQSIPDLVIQSVQSCDVDIRRELFNGIILTGTTVPYLTLRCTLWLGGTSMFSQMRDRLEKELVDGTTQVVKIKVVTPVNSSERKFNVWIGMCLVCSAAGVLSSS